MTRRWRRTQSAYFMCAYERSGCGEALRQQEEACLSTKGDATVLKKDKDTRTGPQFWSAQQIIDSSKMKMSYQGYLLTARSNHFSYREVAPE